MPRESFRRRILSRKSIAEINSQQVELKRSLGPLNLVLLGIGSIIGAGIFVQTGRAAAEYAGPAVMVSFMITGLLAACVGLCYAELASAVPVSGSAYSYTYVSMGEGAAWIMGLLVLLEYGLAASTVAVGWSGYFTSLLAGMHVSMPPELSAAPGTAVKNASGTLIASGIVNAPAMLVIAAITLLLLRGTKESAIANNIIVAIKLTVVILFIAIGSRYVHPALWSPLVPPEVPPPPAGSDMGFWHQAGRALAAIATADNSTKYGFSGVIHAAAIVFSAYLGFEAVSTTGSEARNPAKDMPIGILGALTACTLLYVITSAVLVGIVPYKSLDNAAPLAVAVNRIGLPWFGVLVKVGALAGLSSVMLVSLYGQTRIFYSMSIDGLLPKCFARVNKASGSPWINTVIVGVLTMGGAGFMSLATITDLTSVGALSAFALVCITVIYLRLTQPEMVRPFRTPLFPFVPVLGAAMCIIVLLSLMATQTTRHFFLIYLAVGGLAYFAYGIRHSKLRRDVWATAGQPTDLAGAEARRSDNSTL
jgi:APA family basic amino acid/polyamine antiporter